MAQAPMAAMINIGLELRRAAPAADELAGGEEPLVVAPKVLVTVSRVSGVTPEYESDKRPVVGLSLTQPSRPTLGPGAAPCGALDQEDLCDEPSIGIEPFG